ncbi:hypothetical protein KP001_03960 [Geomonas subterranea]|uniref:Uncharacterized protein n=1 Tax=Geomonas subterranea TaxID=2847989 RepID=A0ABX8LMZ4_9BACT|nr:hypothetical protein [Geomonas subterranea]QXE91704.1 hypothetical protein KP001_03960 [Geomonas subterranea]QXM10203.1 hypothetical protein KP002_03535 [Geomonas subterranea]
MKKIVFIAVALIIGVALAVTVSKVGEVKTVTVGEIGNNPQIFTETITLAGVMAGFSQYDKAVIGVMDPKEAVCKSGCEKVYIPVKYPAQPPKVGDEIRATGKFTKYQSGYMFIATKLKVVKHHNLGS